MLKEYEHKGVVVIPSVFTEEECDRIKSEAYGVTDDQIKVAGYKHVPSEQAYNKKSLIFFLELENYYPEDVRTLSRWSWTYGDTLGGHYGGMG